MTAGFEAAQRIADAVLWEGYVLYPYRASAAKNQVRWQFGVLAPRAHSEADGSERWHMRTACVVDAGRAGRVDVRVRHLHVQERTVEAAAGDGFTPVAELEADGRLWASWDEAVEHVIDIADVDVTEPGTREVPIRHGAWRDVESLGAAGRIVRSRQAVDGLIRVDVERQPGPYPLATVRVTIENLTAAGDLDAPRADVMRRSLVGVHTLLRSHDATFVSLLEPPEFAKSVVERCDNEGTFPVLVGDRRRPTLVLSSPIILYDFPEVAAESQGDLCDATEIDEILALRILTLTDDEKRLARSTDPRAAAIVDRIEAFSPDVFASLHGEMRRLVEDTADPWSDAVCVGGIDVAKGSRVRLRPGGAGRRTDAQDLFLAGREATVEGVFSDLDGDQHVAVTVDDDHADVRHDRGRFLYFHPDEVEPLA